MPMLSKRKEAASPGSTFEGNSSQGGAGSSYSGQGANVSNDGGRVGQRAAFGKQRDSVRGATPRNPIANANMANKKETVSDNGVAKRSSILLIPRQSQTRGAAPMTQWRNPAMAAQKALAGERDPPATQKGAGSKPTTGSHAVVAGDDDDDAPSTAKDLLAGLMDAIEPLLERCLPESNSRDDSWLQSHLGDIFMQHSEKVTIPPGEKIITQGERADEMVLVLKGSVVVRRTQPDGTVEELSIIRSAGETLGELSFLLGIAAVADVIATPVAEGQTDVLEPTVVCKLHKNAAVKVLKEEPEHMVRFFWTLSVTLAKRVMSVGAQSKKLTIGSKAPDEQAVQLRKGRSALDIAQSFGMYATVKAGDRYAAERDLLATFECAISDEVDGKAISTNVQSTVFLFGSQLCIEQALLGVFAKRDAIPLSQVIPQP